MKLSVKQIGIPVALSFALAAGALTGCAGASSTSSSSAVSNAASSASAPSAMMSAGSFGQAAANAPTEPASGSILDTTDMFSDRDMEQAADTSSAKTITVSSGDDVTISEEGVYVLSGTATDCTVTVNADSSAKVQLVLDDVSITNSDAAAIYVASADKVFVTTASGSTNELTVTGSIAAVGDENVDGAIYSKDDLVLNGTGTLTINSSGNGIVGKDDVKVTGGTYNITSTGHGIQGKDSVAIADGTFSITAGKDAVHSENDEDYKVGYIYVAGGTLNLKAESDGLGATSVAEIDGGAITIDAAEGIEGTYVQMNNGNVTIQATDDGINATTKSSEYGVAIEINGGSLNVSMASGDTDALDSNGSLFITGGTVDITAQFAFDYDGTSLLSGGTVTVNGEQVTEITESMMMGGGQGGPGGQGGSMGAPSGQSGSMGAPNASGQSGSNGAAR